jgi:hypothetical protein
MNFGRPASQRDDLGQSQIARRSQIHSHKLAVERCFNDTSACFETGLLLCARDFLDESRKTTRPVAAHIGGRSVVIVKIPRPIRLSFPRRHKQKQTIRPNTALPMTKPHNLLGRQTNLPGAVINQNEVVAGSIHFGERQIHGAENKPERQKRKLFLLR